MILKFLATSLMMAATVMVLNITPAAACDCPVKLVKLVVGTGVKTVKLGCKVVKTAVNTVVDFPKLVIEEAEY